MPRKSILGTAGMTAARVLQLGRDTDAAEELPNADSLEVMFELQLGRDTDAAEEEQEHGEAG